MKIGVFQDQKSHSNYPFIPFFIDSRTQNDIILYPLRTTNILLKVKLFSKSLANVFISTLKIIWSNLRSNWSFSNLGIAHFLLFQNWSRTSMSVKWSLLIFSTHKLWLKYTSKEWSIFRSKNPNSSKSIYKNIWKWEDHDRQGSINLCY